jgi:hypothetical protein
LLSSNHFATWLIGTAVIAATQAVAFITSQDIVAWAGVLSSVGLGLISLYGRAREERRKQDALDEASEKDSLSAKVDDLEARLKARDAELADARARLQKSDADRDKYAAEYLAVLDRLTAAPKTDE